MELTVVVLWSPRAPGHSPMAQHWPFPRRSSPSHPPGAGSPLALGRDGHGGVRPADFPVLKNLAPEDLASQLSRLALALQRQQRRGLTSLKPSRHRRLQIREDRSPLLITRRQHRPDPFAPAVATLAPRPLRDQAVDHHEPDRLFRQIVRRSRTRSRDEPK